MPWATPTVCRAPGCPARVKTPGFCDDHRKAAHRAYNADRSALNVESDRAYRTARWRALRESVLLEEPLCRSCAADGKVEVAVLVDHIQPVKAGGEFWDRDNLQPLCNLCHERKSHAEGSRFFKVGPRSARSAADLVEEALRGALMPGQSLPAWLPAPAVPVEVICGPIGSGRAAHVAQHAGAADLVLDIDVLAARLTGKPIFHATLQEISRAVHARNSLLALKHVPWPKAWLIVSAGSPAAREFWRDKMGSITVLPFDRHDCFDRVRRDTRRPAASLAGIERAILDWH